MPDIDAEMIIEDLNRLIGVKRGFDRPEAILSEVQYVLDLEAVVRAAEPRSESRVERVRALREVLKEVTMRIRNEQTREAARIMVFLETDDGVDQLNLGERFTEIETRQGI